MKTKLQYACSVQSPWKNSPGRFTGSIGLDGSNGSSGFGRSNRLNGPGCPPSPFCPPVDGSIG
ncbi:hypothetical protein SLEP1_g38282 [Rubroshorea leprosula]|uniref:Uncharacterized protein n=1 Tax=Rubroshorea leprosula TaxID=152421 RepID=A0AAV5KY24_9ROSI|nr:hypothetical protein SLEP1_g38282 [Rubroshorea leprosula]